MLDYDNDNDNDRDSDNDAVVFSIVRWFVRDLWATNGRDSVRGRQAR
jgi:hypothetical protein